MQREVSGCVSVRIISDLSFRDNHNCVFSSVEKAVQSKMATPPANVVPLVGLIERRGMIPGFLSAVLDGISGPLTIERVESSGRTETPIYDHAERVSCQDTVDGRQDAALLRVHVGG
jgi:hypothetical protein